MSDVGEFSGVGDGGGSGSMEMPARYRGETEEDYIKRLTALGLYGGNITDQPLIKSDNVNGGTGTTSGGGAGAVGSPIGTTSGAGAGKAGSSQGTTSGLSGGEQSGKGVWEPDNSGSVSVRPSPGGGGSTPGQTPHQSALANFIVGNVGGGGGSSGGSPIAGSMGMDNFGKFTPKGSGSPAGRNLLLKYLNYVQPAYRNQPNPFSVDMNVGSPGVNYLNQLMRGGR